jgi:hypothetical protein
VELASQCVFRMRASTESPATASSYRFGKRRNHSG